MLKLSAGLLMYRRRGGRIEVLLAHPGGPFWKNKDEGAWSIPKGEYAEGESALDAAQREFREETGFEPGSDFVSLGEVKQPSGKIIRVWAFEGHCDPAKLHSNTFSMEWPPKSGHTREFPEVDRAGWFSVDAAREKLLKGQVPFLDRLTAKLVASSDRG
ncbi:MAG TPA: NUDIX domain-containing protein [Candidatus Aquilonibacter sp.]|nr:NUDIX domain-containing protein [Candidatus Aquilonibacter sp.]